jgi:hypothetical protein
MPRRRLQPGEKFLRGLTRRHQERERIALILRGPELGVPLWVSHHLWPCSACLKLKPYKQFKRAGVNRRCEPVCDDCREHPVEVQATQPRHNAVAQLKRRARAVSRRRLTAPQLRKRIERMALADPLANLRVGILGDDREKYIADRVVEEMLALSADDWDVLMKGEHFTAAITPPVTIVVLEPQDDLSGWTFDLLYDVRDDHAQ